VSDTTPDPDRPVISRKLAAQAIVNYFLANADAGNHAANDELIAELARRQHQARQHGDRR
jgi:predicted transcriptional regulator